MSTLLPVAFSFYTPYRTRDGCPFTVVFTCGPNVAVDAIAGVHFLRYTGSIMYMNDKILDMTMVDECSFPINYCVPSTSTPVVDADAHSANMNMSYYEKFLTKLDVVK